MGKNNPYRNIKQQKTTYKLHKVKKLWLTTTMTTLAFGLGAIAMTNHSAHADTTSVNTNVNSSTVTSASNTTSSAATNNQSSAVNKTSRVATSSSTNPGSTATNANNSKLPNLDAYYDQFDRNHVDNQHKLVTTEPIKVKYNNRITYIKPNHHGLTVNQLTKSNDTYTVKTKVHGINTKLITSGDKLKPLNYTHGEIKSAYHKVTNFTVTANQNMHAYQKPTLIGKRKSIKANTNLTIKQIKVYKHETRFKLANNLYISANRFYTSLKLNPIDTNKYQGPTNSVTTSNATSNAASNRPVASSGTTKPITSVFTTTSAATSSVSPQMNQVTTTDLPIGVPASTNTNGNLLSNLPKPFDPTLVPTTPNVSINNSVASVNVTAPSSASAVPSSSVPTKNSSSATVSNNSINSNSTSTLNSSQVASLTAQFQGLFRTQNDAVNSLASSVANSVSTSMINSYTTTHANDNASYTNSVITSMANSVATSTNMAYTSLANALTNNQQSQITSVVQSLQSQFATQATPNSAIDTTSLVNSITNSLNNQFASQSTTESNQNQSTIASLIASATQSLTANANSQTNSLNQQTSQAQQSITASNQAAIASVTQSLTDRANQANIQNSQIANSVASSVASSVATATINNLKASLVFNSNSTLSSDVMNSIANSAASSAVNSVVTSYQIQAQSNQASINNMITSVANSLTSSYAQQTDTLSASNSNAQQSMATSNQVLINSTTQSLVNSANQVSVQNSQIANSIASSVASSVTAAMVNSLQASITFANSSNSIASDVVNSMANSAASSAANSVLTSYQAQAQSSQNTVTSLVNSMTTSLSNSYVQQSVTANTTNSSALSSAIASMATSITTSMNNVYQTQVSTQSSQNSVAISAAITAATNSLSANDNNQLSNAIQSAANSMNTSFANQIASFNTQNANSIASTINSAIASATNSLATSVSNIANQLANDVKANKHYYDILDYGAKANDPNFDNGAVINQIINALPGDGGTIVVPTGDFYVSTPIVLNHNYVHIQGMNQGMRSNIDPESSDSVHPGGGSRLILTNNTATGIQIGTANTMPRISGIDINGLNIMGQNNNADHVTQTAISGVQNSDGINVHDNTIINVDYGVVLSGADTPQVKNNWISEVGNSVQLLGSSQQAQVENNYLGAQPSGITLKLDSPYAATISGNNIYPDGAENIEINNGSHTNITNNNLQSFYNGMIILNGNSNHNVISNNIIYDKSTKDSPFGHDSKYGVIHIEGSNNTINSNNIQSDQGKDDTRILIMSGNDNDLKMNSISGANNDNATALIVVNGNANNTHSIYNDVPASAFQNGNNTSNININFDDANSNLTNRSSDLDNPIANSDYERNATFNQSYHFNIPAGFMNDIQSIVRVGDHYNIYYLANPLFNKGGDTNWGLVQTSDFKSFTDKGLALLRNQGSWGSVATGSVIANNQNGHIIDNTYPTNTLFAYFTSYKDGIQTEHKAYSTDDGLTFNPVQNDLVASPSAGIESFRDSKVFYNAPTNKLVMYLAEGPGAGGSWIHAYQSDTGNSWTYLGDASANAANFTDNAPGNFECPNLIQNVVDQATGQKKAILFFGGNGSGHTNNYYSVGTVDSNGIFHADTYNNATPLDGGDDDYAANYMANGTNDTTDSITTIGWLGSWSHDWGSFANSQNNGHIGSFTLPKTLTLVNGKLQTSIIEPNNHLIFTENNANSLYLSEDAGKAVVNFNNGISNNNFQLTQKDTVTNFNFTNGQVQVSQDKGLPNPTISMNTTLPGPVKQVVFYIDKSSVEMYLPEYGKVYTVQKLSTDNNITLTSSNNADSIQLYHMDFNMPGTNNNNNLNTQLSDRAQSDLSSVKNDDMTNFDQQWAYDGTDLGATYSQQQTQFKVWAPTAKNVQLIEYNDTTPTSGIKSITDMTRGLVQDPNHHQNNTVGVFRLIMPGDLNNTAYAYRITHNDGSVVDTQDPYSTAIVRGGQRSVVVNLNDTNPTNWSTTNMNRVSNATDAIVGETSVRDITENANSGVSVANRGKFLGLTEDNTIDTTHNQPSGLNYLKQSGLNYIQLMPFFDTATIDKAQQNGGYNWGYDPRNYNAVEAAYASNLNDPTSGIRDLKNMVQTLHQHGLNVIMDVVYNHMYSAGDSPFEKVIPGYYFRRDNNGNYTNSSYCGNDFASNHEMTSQYIVNSVNYWANEYGIDGFRFDEQGNLDIKTMQAISNQQSPKHILLYGEGFQFPTTLPTNDQANQANANQLPKVGDFNDSLMYSAVGGGYSDQGAGWIGGNLNGNFETTITKSILGGQNINGTTYINPGQLVNFMENHDNRTLNDQLTKDSPDDDKYMHQRRIAVANTMIMLSQGMPFTQVGQEFGRSKDGYYNTDTAPDLINAINWDDQYDHAYTIENMKELIAMRKYYPEFRYTNYADINQHIHIDNAVNNSGVISYTITDGHDKFVILYNVSPYDITIGPNSNNFGRLSNNYNDIDFSQGTDNLSVGNISHNGSQVTIQKVGVLVHHFTI